MPKKKKKKKPIPPFEYVRKPNGQFDMDKYGIIKTRPVSVDHQDIKGLKTR